eukprot:3521468-Amphidinium_carterae.1
MKRHKAKKIKDITPGLLISIVCEASGTTREVVNSKCEILGWSCLELLCYALAVEPEFQLPLTDHPILGFIPPLRRATMARLHECGDRLKELSEESKTIGVCNVDEENHVIQCKYTKEVVPCQQLEDGEEYTLHKN